MQKLTKGLLGAGVASLLAYGSHVMTGADYVAGIELEAQSVLASAGVDGAELSIQREPLARIATVTGVTDAQQREEIRRALLATGKVRSVNFETGDDAAGEGSDEDAASVEGIATGIEDSQAVSGASEEQVADCQTSVDAFMEGKSINFNSGSAALSADSIAIVDGLSSRLSACTGMSVAVAGHTDATGSDAVNQQISQSRADAVAAALAERGVSAARITATGFGSSRPLIEGDGANAANRRIEFTLDAGGSAAPQEGE